METIRQCTERYEKWLGKRLVLLRNDLQYKHSEMSLTPFSFLRATFYRWISQWPEFNSDLASAPRVLAVGDLHVENFGTWRDSEGRLVWGINDFDEAYPLPYTQDLVRLAASAHLAIAQQHLSLDPNDACDCVLRGYNFGLARGGGIWTLGEHHHWLRGLALNESRDPVRFWEKMDQWPTLRRHVPDSARKAMERLLPKTAHPYRVIHRRAGLGSLGRERYVAIAQWNGGKIAREAKALCESACRWSGMGGGTDSIYYQEIVDGSIRACDPYVKLKGRWLVRRLAPDCGRVELHSLPKARDEVKLLEAMGAETANVHLGTSKKAAAIRNHLEKMPHRWLHKNVEVMVKAVNHDWKQWRGAGGSHREAAE
jgi:hypothetical protein